MLFTDNEFNFAEHQNHQDEIDEAVNSETQVWINMSVTEVASLNPNVMSYLKQLESQLNYYREMVTKLMDKQI